MPRTSKALSLTVAGFVLLQIAWIWTLAPFSSMDEVDHAFRAASVGRGHLLDRRAVEHGRGDLIEVPRDIVEAAQHRCIKLRYVGHDNCFPVGTSDSSGQEWIASAAARYDPAYYLVIGWAARPFHGATALYVMRAVTALLCDAFLALALCIALRRRSPWPALAILVGATPVLLCATATAAPNGVGMSAALSLWTAAAAVLGPERRSRVGSGPLWVVAVSLAALMLTHTTGLLWAAVGGLGLLIVLGRQRLCAWWRQRRPAMLGSIGVVACSAVFSAAWTIMQRTNDPGLERTSNGPVPWSTLVGQPLLWTLQTIGAAPFRNQPGPSVVFVLGLTMFAFVVLNGLRRTPANIRRLVAVLATVALLFPLVATVLTYDKVGFAWQGRYELPLGYGILVLSAWWVCGPRIDRYRGPAGLIVVGANTVMQAATLVNLRTSTIHWTSADGGSPPPVAALVLLCFVVAAAMTMALRLGLSRPAVEVPAPELEGSPA